MASSISKLDSEVRPDGSASERGDIGGKKRSHEDRELEEAKRERDDLRYQLKREREREARLERAGKKKTKGERDGDRDISEKIALGMAQPTSKDGLIDQRLFN